MWDWERASVPYRPIYRRRLLRRRVLTLLIIAAIVLPYYLYHHARATQTVGQRVFDQVVSTVALRYFDPSYHGVSWRAVADQYRPLVVNAPTVRARYAALRSMLARLHDSHTAVYSPQDLQPPGDRRGHAVFGMTPDGATNGPAVDWKTLAPGVGYLRISSFPDSMHSVLRWAMSDLGRDRALVLDLRGNPGGLVDSVDAVAGVFLPVGTLISTGTRRYHFFGSQRFTATSDAGVTYGGRLVVLVDTNSRSGAESLARALQYYHRATLVGTQTAGKVLGVDVEMALDDGGLLRVATLDMHAPDGQRLEGHGVSPDLTVSAATRQVPAALALLDETTTTAPTAAPDAFGCPIGVKGLWRRAIGSVHGYTIYRVEIETTGRFDRARLLAQGAKGTEPSSILARGLTGKQTVYFTWPSDDVIGLEVVEVGGNGIAEMTGCLGAPGHSIEIDKDSLRFPETQTFDDSQVSLGPEIMTTQKVTDADFLTKVSPKYPELIREQGIQGFATVVVIVEKGGDLIDARIYRSSGNKVLDQSAIDAARASTYSEPRIGDTPIVEAYLAEYRWGLEPR